MKILSDGWGLWFEKAFLFIRVEMDRYIGMFGKYIGGDKYVYYFVFIGFKKVKIYFEDEYLYDI